MIGFIGCGNMAKAMISGLLNSGSNYEINIFDNDSNKLEQFRDFKNIFICENNKDVVSKSKYIILAVKPSYYEEILKDVKDFIEDQVIISITPGKKIDWFKSIIGKDKRIVRAMPNTPALIQKGVVGICYSSNLLGLEINAVTKLFESFSVVVKVKEDFMDLVVGISGSLPAYVFLFIEALMEKALEYELEEDKAKAFILNTVIGSTLMVEKYNNTNDLIKMVSSPNGTTVAALKVLNDNNFKDILKDAVDACIKRSKEL